MEALAQELAAARQEALELRSAIETAAGVGATAAEQRSEALRQQLAGARHEIDALKVSPSEVAASETESKHTLAREPDRAGVLVRELAASSMGGLPSQGSDGQLRAALTEVHRELLQTRPASDSKALARATALIRLGDIAGAQLLLERALEAGSARAAFMLAETYDPHVLGSWRMYSVRTDAKKASELYGRAYEGGIVQAKQRAEALAR